MISLVIPAYNEEAIIENTVSAALDFLRSTGEAFELLVVDDGSTDQTAALVRNMQGVRLLSYAPNAGKGYAIRKGILASAGEVVAFTDADLAYGLDSVGQAIRLLRDSDADLVLGSRMLAEDGYASYPVLRLWGSRLFHLLTRLISGLNYDTQCGLKVFSRQAAEKIFPHCETNRFAFDFEIMLLARRLGISVQQLPVRIVNHRASSIHLLRDSVTMAWDVLKIRRRVAGVPREQPHE